MRSFKHLLLAAVMAIGLSAPSFALGTLGGSAFPYTPITQPPLTLSDAFNQLLLIINGQTAQGNGAGSLLINTAATVDPFSTNMSNNPLLSSDYTDTAVASANAAGGQIILSGVASRTIFPGIPTVMVSGTAATATSLKILCSPSAKLLATLPVAMLVTSVPVTPFSSTSTAGALGVPGSALGNGCVAGDSVVASTVGTAMTTTTDIYINLPYTVQ